MNVNRHNLISVRKVFSGIILIAGIIHLCHAEEEKTAISFSGYGAIQEGQIVSGTFKNITLDHQWQQFMYGGFDVTARVNQRLKIVLGTECALAQAVYTLQPETDYASDLESSHAFFIFYLNQMQGIYSFGDISNPVLQCRVGYFRYNYNTNVKSLGEYLFRATAYPGYIINKFASPFQRLPGFMATVAPVKGLTVDALLTTEVQSPVGDFTPSLVAKYAFGEEPKSPMFEFGAGVSLTRFLPVNPELTTPKVAGNDMVTIIDTMFNDTTTPYDDVIRTDTTYFSFKATKLMAYFSFDIKKITGDFGMLGEQDLKLYGETCLLGVKNYKELYDNRLRRLPTMVGFNIPAFRILDVLSAEVEWYDNKFINNYQLTYIPRVKVPMPYNKNDEFKPHPWYWDIHLEKTLVKGFKFVGEVGRTHYFTQAKLAVNQDFAEECPRKGDWQFTTMLQYYF